MSFCLLLFIALPIIFNTEYILGLWLKDVPAHSSLFVQLFLVFALSESLSNPMITAMLATGDIRNYQLVVGGLQLLNLPVSYLLLRFGAMPEVTVMVAIAISQICLFARLVMLSKATGFPVAEYLADTYGPMLFKVAPAAVCLPLLLSIVIPGGLVGFLVSGTVCVINTAGAVYMFGVTTEERKLLKVMIAERLKRK